MTQIYSQPWAVDICSADEEIPYLYEIVRFIVTFAQTDIPPHYDAASGNPHPQSFSSNIIRTSKPKFRICQLKQFYLCNDTLLNFVPTSKMEDQASTDTHICLLKRTIFAGIFISLRCLSQQPENAPCRGDESPLPPPTWKSYMKCNIKNNSQSKGPHTWSNKFAQQCVLQQETVSIHDTVSLRKLQSLGK